MVQEERDVVVPQTLLNKMEQLKRDHLIMIDIADDLYNELQSRSYLSDDDAKNLVLLWLDHVLTGGG
jgi:hypothetical protein